jgi:hypothetical protein
MEEFDKMKKMGGEEYSSKHREQLRAEIEETFSQYKVRRNRVQQHSQHRN